MLAQGIMGMNLKTIAAMPCRPFLASSSFRISFRATPFVFLAETIIPSPPREGKLPIYWLERQENDIDGTCPSLGKGFLPVTT